MPFALKFATLSITFIIACDGVEIESNDEDSLVLAEDIVGTLGELQHTKEVEEIEPEDSANPSSSNSSGSNNSSSNGSSSSSGTSSSSSGTSSSSSGTSSSSSGTSSSTSLSAQTCSNSQARGINLETANAYSHQITFTANSYLPPKTSVTIFEWSDEDDARFFDETGSEKEPLLNFRERLNSYPGINVDSLSGRQLICEGLRGSYGESIGGIAGVGKYQLVGDDYIGEGSAGTVFPQSIPMSEPEKSFLFCNGECPSCGGGGSSSGGSSIHKFAKFTKGCNVKKLYPNQDGTNFTAEINNGPPTTNFGFSSVISEIWRLKDIVGGYDELGCTLRDPELMAEYEGPHDDYCGCDKNGCYDDIVNPSKSTVFACRRVEECREESISPLITGTPTDWRSGKTITVDIDWGEYKKKWRDALIKTPKSEHKPNVGSGTWSEADLTFAADAYEDCAPWNALSSVKLVLEKGNYNHASCNYTFHAVVPDSPKKCKRGLPFFMPPWSGGGFVGYTNQLGYATYEIIPQGYVEVLPRNPNIGPSISGSIGFKLRMLETKAYEPPPEPPHCTENWAPCPGMKFYFNDKEGEMTHMAYSRSDNFPKNPLTDAEVRIVGFRQMRDSVVEITGAGHGLKTGPFGWTPRIFNSSDASVSINGL